MLSYYAQVNGEKKFMDAAPLRADDAAIDKSFKAQLDGYRQRPVLCDNGNWYASVPDAMALTGKRTFQGGLNFYHLR